MPTQARSASEGVTNDGIRFCVPTFSNGIAANKPAACFLIRLKSIAVLAGLAVILTATQPCDAEQKTTKRALKNRVDFASQIRPLLRKHCYQCHGREVQEGGVRLDRKKVAFAGGKNGKVILPKNSKASRLLQLVGGTDKRGRRMPPKGEGRALTKAEVDLLRLWIDQGANWPDSADAQPVRGRHWSFQPIRRPAIPRVKRTGWVRNPIDAFILAKLERAGMTPAPAAGLRTLARRISFDLLGLPPEPDDVDRLIKDSSPNAWERLVDRLLADPRFGERQGRYWLDLVRYADTNGYEVDGPKPLAWKYRDYVIRALNADKPYDRFILEQLAGDELPDADTGTVLATGFYRVGPWDAERGASVQKSEVIAERFNELDDIVSTTSQVFLGLTMGCARCHDHKFDPLTIRDYYSMVSIFNPLRRHHKGRTELTRPALPPHRMATATSTTKTDKQASAPTQGYFFYEPSPNAPVTRLLKRGNPIQPGEVVAPAVPASLVTKQPAFEKPDRYTSRRRISLARWIADKNNPLTPRVIVNRVWQHHFGVGLVRTPNDFGRRGAKPSHPALLDWLSHWFVHDARFSLKRLHRLILTSNTYRMSKRRSAVAAAKDPDNRLLSAMPYRRLEVEAIRDAMLAASGRLRQSMYGPGMYPHVPADARRSGYNPQTVWKSFNERDASRRTVYAYVKRTLPVPFLDTFDFCDTTGSSARRNVSTVAPQALELLNGDFVNRQARHFADRLEREALGQSDRQIRLAYRYSLGRDPTAVEVAMMRRFLQQEQRELLKRDRSQLKADDSKTPSKLKPSLWLDASLGIEKTDAGLVTLWKDRSGNGHHAKPSGSPKWTRQAIGGRPAVRFDGKRDWFALSGKVITSQQFTIIAVVTDTGTSRSHRNLFGNWNGVKGNSGSSVFLGSTNSGENGRRIRLTDHYIDPALRLKNPNHAFVLTAVADSDSASIFQNARRLGRRGSPLPKRRLDTAWMVGRQGTAGEYWHGAIAELLVFNRALNEGDRRDVWSYLGRKYGLEKQLSPKPLTEAEARRLALARMCRVLFNLNEFVYTD